MSVGMQVNSLPEKKSSNPLLWGAGIGAGLGAASSTTTVALGRYAWKKRCGIDSFESAQKYMKNVEKIYIGSLSLTKEQALDCLKKIFKNPGKYVAKHAAIWGAVGLAIGGLVALCKSDEN